jgi:hypothetical protein
VPAHNVDNPAFYIRHTLLHWKANYDAIQNALGCYLAIIRPLFFPC